MATPTIKTRRRRETSPAASAVAAARRAAVAFEPVVGTARAAQSQSQPAVIATSSHAPSAVPIKVRLHPDVMMQVRYWASREGVSANEFIARAVEQTISTANQNYDLPVLEVQRLNQVADGLKSLSENVRNLELVVHDGLGSLLALARGDDYLLNVDTEV